MWILTGRIAFTWRLFRNIEPKIAEEKIRTQMASGYTASNRSSKLKERWLSLFDQSHKGEGDIPSTVLDWWDCIEAHYNENTRHYHTLQHVESLLGLLDEHEKDLSCSRAVAFAIYFHDVIYDPKADDNEEKSAEAFLRFSTEHLSDNPEMSRNIHEWILLTKKHFTPEHKERFGAEDKHFFLDFDMQVLGWPAEQYQVYARQIRQEYIHYPDTVYRAGRVQVLRKFLERPRVYATQLFHEHYEEIARHNILEEIKQLEAG